MSNQVLDVIKARRSIRAYKDDALTSEQLDLLVKAALHSPSAMNKREWHLSVVTNKELLLQLDKDMVEYLFGLGIPALSERIKSRGNTALYNAPAVFIVSGPKDNDYNGLDGGVMSQTITLAAKSLELDSVIIAMLGRFLASEGGQAYIPKLGLPTEYVFVVSVAVGHAASEPIPRELTFDDKVTYIN